MGDDSKNQMSALPECDLPGDEVTDACDVAFDPGAYFDRWLADVQAATDQLSFELPSTNGGQDQEIYVSRALAQTAK